MSPIPRAPSCPECTPKYRFRQNAAEGILTAPLEGRRTQGSVARVFAVDDAGVVRIVPVQLGVEDAHRAEIVSGLSEGDLMITGRRAGLNAGDKVKQSWWSPDR